MDNKKIITKEMMLNARDYLPLAQKEEWAQSCAEKCIDHLAITVGEEEMPPMYAVNTGLKSRYLMSALIGFYFNKEFDSDDAPMSVASYDEWAEAHPLNQIERLKADASLRDKCFDLLSDYKDLEKRLASRIGSFLTVQNDPVLRQSQYTASQMKEIPALLEKLQALQKKGELDGSTESQV